jgi:RNA polymerase sigma-70 factor (ECF subfamily)
MIPDTDLATSRPDYATTLWTEVHLASAADPERRRAALEALAQSYWPPLYAFARRRRLGPEDAQDAVQAFFTRLIETDGFASADPARGRFRTWLRAAFGYFLSDSQDRGRALKRGGGRPVLALDFRDGQAGVPFDPSERTTPERVFDREWARLVIRRGLDSLRRELVQSGRGEHFDLLRSTLGPENPSMKELARRYGIGEQDAKNRLFRARRRLRELMLEEVRGHLENPAQAGDEIRALWSALE